MDWTSSHSQKTIIIGMLGIFLFAFMWAFFSFGNFWSTENITVPDVTGKQVEIAKEILSKKHLDVSVKEVESSEVPVGEVISQTPSGGAVVKENRTIYLTVSKGNKGEEVLIPDLRDLTLDEAKKKLKEIGLQIGSVHYKESDTYADGKIISQNPASPQKVAKGTAVDVVICRKNSSSKPKDKDSAKSGANVPNTSGMSLDAAVQTLENAGYTVGNVANLDSSKDSGQAKVTGQSVRDDKTVDLTVEYPASETTDSSSTGTTTDSNNANNQESAGTPHYGTVNISVPSGASSQHVQIVVHDENGSRVVYDQNQSGGANITKNVSGTGKTRVKVYINNSLVQDQYI